MYAYFKLNITYVNIEICNYLSVSLLLPTGIGNLYTVILSPTIVVIVSSLSLSYAYIF